MQIRCDLPAGIARKAENSLYAKKKPCMPVKVVWTQQREAELVREEMENSDLPGSEISLRTPYRFHQVSGGWGFDIYTGTMIDRWIDNRYIDRWINRDR